MRRESRAEPSGAPTCRGWEEEKTVKVSEDRPVCYGLLEAKGRLLFQDVKCQVSDVAERSCNRDCALTIGFCIVEVLGCLWKTSQ